MGQATSQAFGLYDAVHRITCDVYGCRKPAAKYIGKGTLPYDRFNLCQEHTTALLESLNPPPSVEFPENENEGVEEVEVKPDVHEVVEGNGPAILLEKGFAEEAEEELELPGWMAMDAEELKENHSKPELQAILVGLGLEESFKERTTIPDLIQLILKNRGAQ